MIDCEEDGEQVEEIERWMSKRTMHKKKLIEFVFEVNWTDDENRYVGECK